MAADEVAQRDIDRLEHDLNEALQTAAALESNAMTRIDALEKENTDLRAENDALHVSLEGALKKLEAVPADETLNSTGMNRSKIQDVARSPARERLLSGQALESSRQRSEYEQDLAKALENTAASLREKTRQLNILCDQLTDPAFLARLIARFGGSPRQAPVGATTRVADPAAATAASQARILEMAAESAKRAGTGAVEGARGETGAGEYEAVRAGSVGSGGYRDAGGVVSRDSPLDVEDEAGDAYAEGQYGGRGGDAYGPRGNGGRNAYGPRGEAAYVPPPPAPVSAARWTSGGADPNARSPAAGYGSGGRDARGGASGPRGMSPARTSAFAPSYYNASPVRTTSPGGREVPLGSMRSMPDDAFGAYAGQEGVSPRRYAGDSIERLKAELARAEAELRRDSNETLSVLQSYHKRIAELENENGELLRLVPELRDEVNFLRAQNDRALTPQRSWSQQRSDVLPEALSPEQINDNLARMRKDVDRSVAATYNDQLAPTA